MLLSILIAILSFVSTYSDQTFTDKQDKMIVRKGFAEEPDDPSEDLKLTFDYSLLRAKGHPRLLTDEGGFDDLKKKVTSRRRRYPTLYRLHCEVMNRANKIVELDRGFTSAGEHGLIVDNILACAYAYKMTGKPFYLAKVCADMAKVCTFNAWNPGGLSIGELSFAMGIAYDWLYYDLTLDERTEIHRSLVEKGICPMYKNNRNVKITGNWNQINLGGVSVASMAIYEKDKKIAVQQIEKAIAGNRKGVERIYSPDGTYAEGLGYWEYGGNYQVCFLSCLQEIFGHTAGISEVEGFLQSGEYALFMHGSMNTSFSYSDGGAYADPVLLTSWWFAAQNNDPTLAYREKMRLYDDDDKAYKDTPIDLDGRRYYRLLPAIIVAIRDFDVDSRPVTPPVKEVWSGKGEMPVVIVRHGWKFDGSDVYLGVKGGLANTWETSITSHGHMDAGSFVFEAEGVRWSDDIMRPPYGEWYTAMRKAETPRKYNVQEGVMWDTFRISNLCHSTIVSRTNDGSVKGKLHSTDYDVNGFASIDRVIDSLGRQGAEVNMTPPMNGQVKNARRTVELVNGTDLVVTDEITALDDMDCQIEWRMLSMTESKVGSDGVVLTKDGKVRTLIVSSSDAMITPEYCSWKPEIPKNDNWGMYLEYEDDISNRTIAGWTAVVPKGKTITFITTLRK